MKQLTVKLKGFYASGGNALAAKFYYLARKNSTDTCARHISAEEPALSCTVALYDRAIWDWQIRVTRIKKCQQRVNQVCIMS